MTKLSKKEIIVIILLFVSPLIAWFIGYDAGYDKGWDDGHKICKDSINKINLLKIEAEQLIKTLDSLSEKQGEAVKQ